MPLSVKTRLVLSLCTLGGSLVLIKSLVPLWGDMATVDKAGASVVCAILFLGGIAGLYFNNKELSQSKKEE